MSDFGVRRRALPKTGQTTSYRDGDDGYYQKGWREATRFKDVGDGTVVDNATGLMWPKDWGADGGNDGNPLAWNAAIDWAEALSFAGYDDWRLPNMFEFVSLFDLTGTSPYIHDVFDNVPNKTHHTSTTNPDDTPSALDCITHLLVVTPNWKVFPYNVFAVRDA